MVHSDLGPAFSADSNNEERKDEEDLDDLYQDNDDRSQNQYHPQRIIQPLEMDEEMRISDQQLMDDVEQEIGEPYQAPDQILQIVSKFHAALNQDPRRNGTRNMQPKKQKTSFAWSQHQDQQIVGMTIAHLNKGADMTTIEPYDDMKRRSPKFFGHIEDPKNIMRRLQALCSPQNSVVLEDYCGYSIAQTDEAREKASKTAQIIRASCLNLRQVKQQKLDGLIRPKISYKSVRKNQPPSQVAGKRKLQ